MRAGGAAGGAHRPQRVAAADEAALGDVDAIEVHVERVEAESVVEHHQPAPEEEVAYQHHAPAIGRHHRRAALGRPVGAGMRATRLAR